MLHPRLAPALALVSLLASAARAENPRVSSQTFRPSPHARDLFDTITSELPAAWEWAASLWLALGTDPLVFVDATGASPDHEAIQTQLSASATASLAVADWLSVGLEVPVFLVNAGQDEGFVGLDPIPSAGLGDVRLSGKVGILTRPAGGDGLGLALELPVGFPTGMAQGFVSDGWTFTPVVAVDLRVGRLLVAGNLGARLRDEVQLVYGTVVGTDLVFRAAASFELVRDRLTLLGEVNGATHDAGDGNDVRVDGLVGADLLLGDGGLHASLAVGRGFADGYGSTSFRAVARFGYEPPLVRDRDGDGLDDVVDKCPAAPEDADGFEDEDGCPDLDNDRDRVADASDKCPNEPEDEDRFEDDDGCPDRDNDGDGAADAADGPGGSCRDAAEDADGFQDDDGCPDPDDDGDGLLDAADKCPREAEDKDVFQDDDGCPDPDNDGDGILDGLDDCPADATNRCGVKVNTCEIIIDQTVYFEYERADIKPESFALLDAVAALLATHDFVKGVEVQGHTDSEGDDAYNLDLSKRRAESVRAYLQNKGVGAARLTAQGYGETRPLGTNATAQGRAKNRRVQFVITDPAQSECGPK